MNKIINMLHEGEKMCYQKESPKEILQQLEEFRKNKRVKEILKYEQV